MSAAEEGDHRLDRGVRASPRQAQMLELASEGLRDKNIAQELGLGLPTIRTYWQRFYQANGVSNRAAAIAIWARSPRVSDARSR
jgi:DNA-binding NarL/FixJ family response regulator